MNSKNLVSRLYHILKELRHHHAAFVAHNNLLADGYDRTLYASMKYSERCIATLAQEQIQVMSAMTSKEIALAVAKTNPITQ
tara:strand:- start:780 stop:1025 length:246 start_codon:yes stop_codon:yes gene_type:complete